MARALYSSYVRWARATLEDRLAIHRHRAAQFSSDCEAPLPATFTRELLNARLLGPVLGMHLMLKSKPYSLIKGFRLFTNSYIHS